VLGNIEEYVRGDIDHPGLVGQMAALTEQVSRLTAATEKGFSDIGKSVGELKDTASDNKARIKKLEELPGFLYSLRYNTKNTLLITGGAVIVSVVALSAMDWTGISSVIATILIIVGVNPAAVKMWIDK
jgi:hypothetical protein